MKAKSALIIIGIILFLGIVGSLSKTEVKPSSDSMMQKGQKVGVQEIPVKTTQIQEASTKKKLTIDEMYNFIETSMTFDEVRKTLGEPDRVQKMEVDVGNMANMEQIKQLTGHELQTKSSFEYWYYMNGLNLLQIGFTDGKVSSRMIT